MGSTVSTRLAQGVELPEGLGPVPPNYPARVYTSSEVLDAVDEVARRHQDNPVLANINVLVRQVLEAPRRANSDDKKRG